MTTFNLEPDDYQPTAPEKKDYGIGHIGCGGIVRGAHLPAYQRFGYRSVVACDLLEDSARQAAETFGIAGITTRIEDVLADRDVQIIDLAVHANQRLPIVEQICRARPPHLLGLLSQKPFAMSWGEAIRMVQLCEEARLPLMINQQARWAPAHRALKLVADSGALGHIYAITHFHRSFQDQAEMWWVTLEDFNIIDHGIHYIDLIRYFSGRDPIRVKATATMQPGQNAVSPLCHTILCEFEPDAMLMAMTHFNNIVRAPQLHKYEWYIDGIEGSAMASHNELVVAFKDAPDHRQSIPIQGRWFPDAFGGSMGEMMRALTEGREPQTSGRDNLNSIKIAYAAVESAQTGNSVTL